LYLLTYLLEKFHKNSSTISGDIIHSFIHTHKAAEKIQLQKPRSGSRSGRHPEFSGDFLVQSYVSGNISWGSDR